MSEIDAVRDAYVASLEAALDAIRRDVLTLGAVWAVDTATAALGVGEVARIPDGIRFRSRQVAFTRWPVPGGEWHLIGPAEMLVPGTVIEVARFNGTRSPTDETVVAVGQVVAERTVIHRDPGPVRYVVTRISRAVKED